VAALFAAAHIAPMVFIAYDGQSRQEISEAIRETDFFRLIFNPFGPGNF